MTHFYGQTYDNASLARRTHLDKAVKYFDMALRAEQDIINNVPGVSENKMEMAFRAACKSEQEAFATA